MASTHQNTYLFTPTPHQPQVHQRGICIHKLKRKLCSPNMHHHKMNPTNNKCTQPCTPHGKHTPKHVPFTPTPPTTNQSKGKLTNQTSNATCGNPTVLRPPQVEKSRTNTMPTQVEPSPIIKVIQTKRERAEQQHHQQQQQP